MTYIVDRFNEFMNQQIVSVYIVIRKSTKNKVLQQTFSMYISIGPT